MRPGHRATLRAARTPHLCPAARGPPPPDWALPGRWPSPQAVPRAPQMPCLVPQGSRFSPPLHPGPTQWGSFPPVAFVRMEKDADINDRIARNQEVRSALFQQQLLLLFLFARFGDVPINDRIARNQEVRWGLLLLHSSAALFRRPGGAGINGRTHSPATRRAGCLRGCRPVPVLLFGGMRKRAAHPGRIARNREARSALSRNDNGSPGTRPPLQSAGAGGQRRAVPDHCGGCWCWACTWLLLAPPPADCAPARVRPRPAPC